MNNRIRWSLFAAPLALVACSNTAEAPKTASAEPAEKAAPPKKDYVEVTVNTLRGLVRHRYEKLPNGEFKYAGVVAEPTEDDATKKQPEAKGGEKSPIQ